MFRDQSDQKGHQKDEGSMGDLIGFVGSEPGFGEAVPE